MVMIIMDENKENNNSTKQKLLFVEDDNVTINVVKRLLKDKYEFDSAYNGEEALEKAIENDYDVFLIDIGLPGNMNGIETTKELKEIKDNKNKPYIAVTAYAMPGDKKFFLSEGLTHYISKPFGFQELIKLIETALKEKESVKGINT
jgi:CheY-like chemotaxis protein